MKKEIFISTDVEATGPIPIKHSMLRFASAAFTIDKELISTYSANLKEIDGAIMDPDTQIFWNQNPDAWNKSRENLKDIDEALNEYLSWVLELKKKYVPIFLAYPAGFDFTFVRVYLEYFIGNCPFGFSCLDLKSYAMGILNIPFKEVTKKSLNDFNYPKLIHSHIALDDAVEQGSLFINLYRFNNNLSKIVGINNKTNYLLQYKQ